MAWRIHLLGKIEAIREERTLSHFESSRVVALLARLALYPRRVHPREELLELLWPEVEVPVARGRLRHTLLVLRRQLEAGLPAGSVLVADRRSVRLNRETFVTDVAEFEQAVARGDHAAAGRLYAGELLPGLWDDWIVAERHRLEALADDLPDGSGDSPPTVPAPTPAPPPGGAGVPRPTAPAYLTAFFGREREQADVAALLRRHRLVTLTGMGGMGKTRLAAEVFRQVAPGFSRAAFVSLAECAGASQIPGRVRAALGLPAAEGGDPLEQVSLHLGERSALLVLDNLEHLTDSGGSVVVESLLARLPGLTCLVTTRRALSVSGERLYPLEPLPEACGAALFLDRAQAVRPGYRVTDGNRADVAAVCRGLEGIPLALELAASRLRAFSASEMRRELERRFDWLARRGVPGDKEDRHRSLAAALEWSWHLLAPSQRAFLAALTLFRGSWSADDAAAIADARDARDRLESLVADSWLTSAAEAGESGATRFSMLQTVRDFGAARLEDAPAARRRYREWFVGRPGRDQNTVAAWEYALEDGDADHAYALADSGYPEWTALTGVEGARALLESTLTRLRAPTPRLRLHAGHQLALVLQRANDRAGGIARMDQTLAEMADAPADVRAEAWMMRARTGMYDEPAVQTLDRLDRCLALASDPGIRAEAMRCKGVVQTRARAYDDALALFDGAEALYPEEHRGRRLLLLHRGVLFHERQEWERARALYRACVEASLAADDPMLRSLCLQNLIDVLAYRGDWQEAVRTGRECLETAARLGDRHALINVLWNLARPLLLAGDAPAAARTMGFASCFWEREVRPLTTDEARERDDLRAEIAAALGGAPACDRHWDEGAAQTLGDALAAAISPR